MLAGKLAFFAPTGDADALAYLAAVEAADGQSLETAVRTAVNDFVVGCKTDGIWTALKASCILMGARTLSGALTPLVGTAPTNNNFVSGDYDRKTGLKGNASTKYLDSNRNNNADAQNSAHQAVYVSVALSSGTHYIGFGVGDLCSYAGGSAMRSRGVAGGGLSGTITALVGLSRSGSAAWTYRYSGATTTGATTASSSPGSGNIYVFARNNGGAAGYLNARMAFYSIGSDLTLSLLESRLSTLYTAIGAAIP